jgi:hypothetical protein
MDDPDALRSVACAVIERAVRDMRMRGVTIGSKWKVIDDFRCYVNATVWLGSSKAAIYMDAVGLEQLDVLYAIKWREHAEEMIDNPDAFSLLTHDDINLLYMSIDRLKPGRRLR